MRSMFRWCQGQDNRAVPSSHFFVCECTKEDNKKSIRKRSSNASTGRTQNYLHLGLENDVPHTSFTMPRKNKNLPYSIRMYWTNFWQQTVHAHHNIFEKLWWMLVSHIFTLLLAPYASKLVCFWRHSESLKKSLKTLFSKKSDVDFEFFWKFKISKYWAIWT